MTDEATTLCQVESLLPSMEFRARLFAMLARTGLYRAPRAEIVAYRAQTAARLIGEGLSRPDLRESLRHRFGVSRRTAYRLIERAIDMRQGRLFD